MEKENVVRVKRPCPEAEKWTFGLGRGPPAVMKKCVVVAVVVAMAAIWCRQSFAQSGAPVNNSDYLSKETENPVTRKITVPLRYEADFLDGADKLTKSTIELDQAVVPFRLNDDWTLITRTKLPAEALPPKKAGDHRSTRGNTPR
jgi:hypothetical protein